MTIFRAFLRDFLRSTSAATSIEYAMIGAGISIMIVAGARSMGSSVSSLYIDKVSGNLT